MTKPRRQSDDIEFMITNKKYPEPLIRVTCAQYDEILEYLKFKLSSLKKNDEVLEDIIRSIIYMAVEFTKENKDDLS